MQGLCDLALNTVNIPYSSSVSDDDVLEQQPLAETLFRDRLHTHIETPLQLKMFEALTEQKKLLADQPTALVVKLKGGEERTILAISRDDRERHRVMKARSEDPGIFGVQVNSYADAALPPPTPFGLMERYRCLPDPKGQVTGGMGFIVKALSVRTGETVGVKFFTRAEDRAEDRYCLKELKTSLLMHQPLHASPYFSPAAATAGVGAVKTPPTPRPSTAASLRTPTASCGAAAVAAANALIKPLGAHGRRAIGIGALDSIASGGRDGGGGGGGGSSSGGSGSSSSGGRRNAVGTAAWATPDRSAAVAATAGGAGGAMGAADDDSAGLQHILRVREVLCRAQVFAGGESGTPTKYFANALVLDWADGGDLHQFVNDRHAGTPRDALAVLLQASCNSITTLFFDRDVKPENFLLMPPKEGPPGGRYAHSARPPLRGMCLKLSDFGFAKKLSGLTTEDLSDDPTTCYQPPERWSALEQRCAEKLREYRAIERAPEDLQLLSAGDIFSLGISAFFTLAIEAILDRRGARFEGGVAVAIDDWGDDGDGDAQEEEEDPEGLLGKYTNRIHTLNLFQEAPGERLFGLLNWGPAGCSQKLFWRHWAAYGLNVPQDLRRVLDCMLHPRPECRWTVGEVLQYIRTNAYCISELQCSPYGASYE
ncbi:hypothetical protein JKP88DRAFT_278813 [Tribonema minus]|uniref:Protein kinase domain-containing protein n=1 Tax=Tribonema minus TaxID=303371 RepID=A0A835YVB4_9STRA|nr:hypothetical protein JKP88DRAFT_278813 [Tribonema minus]